MEKQKKTIWFYIALISIVGNAALLVSRTCLFGSDKPVALPMVVSTSSVKTSNAASSTLLGGGQVESSKDVPNISSNEIGIGYELYDANNDMGPRGYVLKIFIPNETTTSTKRTGLSLISGNTLGTFGFYYAGLKDSLVLKQRQNMLQIQQELYDENSARLGSATPLMNIMVPVGLKFKVLN